jgi:hypothetical chaperone protein
MISCGIDFGTSNSAIAISASNGVQLAPIEGSDLTLPSALFYPVSRPPLYGREAMRAFMEGDEGRFMRSLKRMLGTQMMNYGTLVNDTPRRFDEIIGGFVSYMKKKGEALAGGTIENVVMGRPVHFVDRDPEADYAAEEQLRRIAREAGFRYIEFQFEPIAAAFEHETRLTNEKLALVVDIGGGTSDFTVIRLGPDLAKKIVRKDDILGNSGTRLGGNDLDKDLSLHSFMPPLGYHTTYGTKNFHVPRSWFHEMAEWSKVNFLYNPKMKSEVKAVLYESHAPEKLGRYARVIEKETGHRLLAATEQTKIDLTDSQTATSTLDFIEEGLSVHVTRHDFERAIDERMAKISDTISDCLATAEVQQNQIELIVLTGGPTETPLIKELIRQTFPGAEISEENKLSSVALGLGYDSRRRFGATTS